MRFSPTRRILSILSGAWLVLLLAEPRVLHVCAVHADGMGNVASAHSDAGHSSTTHSHGRAPGHEHSAKCTCLGASSHANAIVFPSVEEITFSDEPVAIAAQLPPAPDAPPSSDSPFFLPYPNGPPVTDAS